jgi:hypothetical protein
MKTLRLAALAVGVAALALPAAASAHPSVYTGTATIVTNPGPPPVVAGQDRHMVTNHGYTTVLRETNGVGSPGGVVSYALLPGALRDTLTQTQQLAMGGTAAQAHATCDVAALNTESAIVGWQEGDPFYNYVPFQKAAAGLDDDPADWIDDVQRLTGVDLAQVSDVPAEAAMQLETLCESAAPAGLGGTFVPADQTQNTIAALASGTVEHATAPLNARITDLTTFTQQLQAQKAAAEQAAARALAQAGQATTLQQENQALKAEVARLKLEATTLRIRPLGRQSPAQLAANGAAVRVTGPAGKRVTVRLLVSAAEAKALGLGSRVLGKQTATIGSDANARVRITLGSRAKRAMRRADRSMMVTFDAVSGDRSASATRRLSG